MMDRKKESLADEGSKFALLAVAMKSGHVVVWKVSFPVTPEWVSTSHAWVNISRDYQIVSHMTQ